MATKTLAVTAIVAVTLLVLALLGGLVAYQRIGVGSIVVLEQTGDQSRFLLEAVVNQQRDYDGQVRQHLLIGGDRRLPRHSADIVFYFGSINWRHLIVDFDCNTQYGCNNFQVHLVP